MALPNWLSQKWFGLIHGHQLVYNTCWEDPRLDRIAMKLGPDDDVLVITSAGCNALDYALDEPRRVHAVDMNPRQNALLELKIAGIRHLDYDTFFAVFGRGGLPGFSGVYEQKLRAHLSESARSYWDRHLRFFGGNRANSSFYFRGSSGAFARLINFYIDRVVRVRDHVTDLLAAPTPDEQRTIYESHIEDAFWSKSLLWFLGLDTTLSMVGVPRPQRQQVERDYVGGISQFIRDSVEAVFASLPISDNYFWRVYLTGSYTPECCPEYLKPQNFLRLKDGLVDRISVHTDSVQGFLEKHPGTISRFVLLDHMDWLSTERIDLLSQEWQAIVDRAAPGARVLWRSGGLRVDFVDPLEVRISGRKTRVGDMLNYDHALAGTLHARDRVHTYGSFYIADLSAEHCQAA
jgi:S-adenosylmethionine-diacylglycerol 3-amino-3-carboxypropyl transferase